MKFQQSQLRLNKETQMKKKLRFLHIPKTAGSTFSRILRNQYRGKRRFVFSGDNESDIKRFRELSMDEQKSIDLYTGHAPILTGLPEADGIPIITMLRDPVSRVKSFCQHVSEGKSPHLLKSFPPESFNLDDFLYSDNNEISNLQSRMLIDYEKYRAVPLLRTNHPEEMKEQALQNLFHKVSCYGIQEYFDESLILIASRLGWRMPFYEYRNRKDIKRLLKFEARHIKRIRELNSIDIDVYTAARSRLVKEINSKSYDKNRLITFKLMQKFMSPILHSYGLAGRAAMRLLR